MSVVLSVVQIVAAMLLIVPLVVFVVCALRRAGRTIDQILREEIGPGAPPPEDAVREPAPAITRVTGPRHRAGNA